MKKLLLLLLLFVITATAFAVQPITLSNPVYDEVGLLSFRKKELLDNALLEYRKDTGNHLAVVIVKDLEGQSLEEYSISLADKLKLGESGEDNGAFLLVAFNDHKMRIEVGRGLEHLLTDANSGRIISLMKPYFARSEFEAGIFLGVSQMAQITGQKLNNLPVFRSHKQLKPHWLGIIIFVLFLVMIFGRGSRGALVGYMLGSMAGSLGGGHSSRGRGGFGGFSGGGGGFSGGGASGGW